METRIIQTADGSRLAVPRDTPVSDIEILKRAPVFSHTHFYYTGNSPHGEDHDNGARSAFLKHIRLWREELTEDHRMENAYFMDAIEQETGFATIGDWMYHVQHRQGESHRQFGYTTEVEFRPVRYLGPDQVQTEPVVQWTYTGYEARRVNWAAGAVIAMIDGEERYLVENVSFDLAEQIVQLLTEAERRFVQRNGLE